MSVDGGDEGGEQNGSKRAIICRERSERAHPEWGAKGQHSRSTEVRGTFHY